MSRHCHNLIVIGIVVGSCSAASFGIAHAYAVSGTVGATGTTYATSSFYLGGWDAFSWQNLPAPFQNFTRSLQSINATNLNIAAPTTMFNFSDTAAQAAHGAFEQFDTWLAGIIGFHISSILTVSLQLISWLLGIVKSGIDWALSWIH